MPHKAALFLDLNARLGNALREFLTLTGASTRQHPAPFPYDLAYRLVRMFSFHGDTVLDPFCGTGTTLLAAIKTDRAAEIDETYAKQALRRIQHEAGGIFERANIAFLEAGREAKNCQVGEEKPEAMSRIKCWRVGKDRGREKK